MKKIASHDDIEIFAPDESRFSFLKSPYAAHKTKSAVDIYYGSFGSEALSPVDGEIIDVRSFDTPTPFKDIDSREYLIAIRQGKYVIKIIHIKPEVSIGETISKGDFLGTFIKNGYFIFWNDPVMHVEVRKPWDYLRASNNLHLLPDIEWAALPEGKTLELDCRVKEVNKKYTLLSAPYTTCGNVRGFAIDGGFLDGFISSTGDGGFFGTVKQQGFFHPELSKIEISKDDAEIKCSGLAFCLSLKEPGIKVIPKKYGDKPISLGDKIHVKLAFY
ncbi:MAG: hypothetical protein OIN85_03210 [Candidatus Methanoperedens sp.]|nr:hypothetical protein [Candidatus Methanoperedens sp.]